jgi:hypothetical protein
METLFHRRIPYARPDDEVKQPPLLPRSPRPERIPDGSIAPIPNPTFEKPDTTSLDPITEEAAKANAGSQSE